MNDAFSMVDERSRALQDILAANVRRLRVARHLSLSELARATGMSKATLSGIENAHGNPTVETLATLANALRVSVSELLEETALAEVRVVRASGATFRERDGIRERPLEAAEALGTIEIAEIALAARQLQELPAEPEGSRVSVYVLEGPLIAGPVERISELGTGDYMSFPADVPHVFAAARRPARALTLCRLPH